MQPLALPGEAVCFVLESIDASYQHQVIKKGREEGILPPSEGRPKTLLIETPMF